MLHCIAYALGPPGLVSLLTYIAMYVSNFWIVAKYVNLLLTFNTCLEHYSMHAVPLNDTVVCTSQAINYLILVRETIVKFNLQKCS